MSRFTFGIILGLIVSFVMMLGSCSKKSENNGTPIIRNDTVINGRLCIENKLDTALLVSINEVHEQFSILKNNLHCSELKGNSTYHINYSSPDIYGDTIIILLSGQHQFLILQ